MDIDIVKKFFEEIDYPSFVEFIDFEWCDTGVEILYIGEDKEVYSFEVYEGTKDFQGYRVQNSDRGCTYFLSIEKQIDREYFEEKYDQ